MSSLSLIVLNWKMNVPKRRITTLVKCIAQNSLRAARKTRIIVCPSHELLSATGEVLKKSRARMFLGAQNCAKTLWGAHTGEVSPESLKQLGCSHVIIGHSERRADALESNESIREKIELLLGTNSLPAPILCIGERKREKTETSAFRVLAMQIDAALKGVARKKLPIDRLVVAYEPVWAIGTGQPVHLDVWKARHRAILKMLNAVLGGVFGKQRNVPILYGGSVSDKNIHAFLESPSGGVLVGGAGQQVDSLARLIRSL